MRATENQLTSNPAAIRGAALRAMGGKGRPIAASRLLAAAARAIMLVDMLQQVQRLGLIGDIHAEDERLAQAIAYLQGRGVDAIVATGDLGDGLGDVERCCELLDRHGVITVRGNHDRWLLEGSMRDLPHATVEASPAVCRFLTDLPGEAPC